MQENKDFLLIRLLQLQRPTTGHSFQVISTCFIVYANATKNHPKEECFDNDLAF